jgi:hypothetical protein
MNPATFHRCARLYSELDRKVSKLQHVQGERARRLCLRSIEKLKRHIENVKRKDGN